VEWAKIGTGEGGKEAVNGGDEADEGVEGVGFEVEVADGVQDTGADVAASDDNNDYLDEEGDEDGDDEGDEEEDDANDPNEEDSDDDNDEGDEADQDGDESDGDCSNWESGDNKRGDAPELLFGVSGEGKTPPCTMNGTEYDAKGPQEGDVEGFRMAMLWNVERRNVCGVSGEGS